MSTIAYARAVVGRVYNTCYTCHATVQQQQQKKMIAAEVLSFHIGQIFSQHTSIAGLGHDMPKLWAMPKCNPQKM